MNLRGASVFLKLICHPKDCVVLILQFLFLLSLPFLSIISLPFYILAFILTKFIPNQTFGKLLNNHDVWVEEEFVNTIPRNSLVTTLTIQGNLSLEEFKSIFSLNVLEAQSSLKPGKIRYPELKQYLTTFMGFHIWKDDPNFQIDNHIVEGVHSDQNNLEKNWNTVLGNIHQEQLNLPYHTDRSPWVITLIRNINNNLDKRTTVLVLRIHHVMADAKSILKLFVECLGQKKLQTATPQKNQQSWFEKLIFYPLFIPNYLRHLGYLAWTVPQCHFHLWKDTEYWKNRDVKTVVAFSPKLLLSDLKQVAKENDVTSSAVVMSIIAGGIRSCGKDFGKMGVSIISPLPKPNHPEYLTNHSYTGFPNLPTDEARIIRRLRKCNEQFLWMKNSHQARILDLTICFGAIQFFPVARWVLNLFNPVIITNIAGEEEGFKVGKLEVADYRMSVGVMQGVTGVVFCVLSYKDGIRVTVIGKESALKREQAEKMVLDIAEEFQLLTGI